LETSYACNHQRPSPLDNERIEIGVARPQHDPTQNYPSERDVRAVLSDLGISEETIDSHLKLLAKMGTGEQLRFPPMDIAQNAWLSRGFDFSFQGNRTLFARKINSTAEPL
jgi:hypothetical protein